MKSRFLIALATVAWPSIADAQCLDSSAIWAVEKDGVRNVIYGSTGLEMFSEVVLEEWRQQKLAWRGRGTVTCSNGAVTCYLLVENASGIADAGLTNVVIEKIDENNDGLSEWAVLAGMGQLLYYSGGAKVEWFNGLRPGEFDRVTMPNIYKFLACRPEGSALPERVLPAQAPPESPTPAAATETPSGVLYGLKALCSAYNREGRLYPDEENGVFSDGLWWMDDVQIVGHEFSCNIEARSADKLSLACTGIGEETWKEDRPFKDTGSVRKIGEVELTRCKP